MQGVADHLRPGGVFVFDAITHDGMCRFNGAYVHFEATEGRFAIRFTYDRVGRQETSEAVLPTGVEVHRRVPIDPADVFRAVQGTDLRVRDYFSWAYIPGWWRYADYCFFVLTKTG